MFLYAHVSSSEICGYNDDIPVSESFLNIFTHVKWNITCSIFGWTVRCNNRVWGFVISVLTIFEILLYLLKYATCCNRFLEKNCVISLFSFFSLKFGTTRMNYTRTVKTKIKRGKRIFTLYRFLFHVKCVHRDLYFEVFTYLFLHNPCNLHGNLCSKQNCQLQLRNKLD